METIESMELPAAELRRAAERLMERADAHVEGDDRYDGTDPEIDAVLSGLRQRYQDATDAYLTAQAWEMEVEHRQDEDEIGPATARREQERVDAIVQDYRSARELLDDADAVLEQDVWEWADPDTQVYDHADHVDGVEFEIEYDGLFSAIEAAEGLYDRAGSAMARLT